MFPSPLQKELPATYTLTGRAVRFLTFPGLLASVPPYYELGHKAHMVVAIGRLLRLDTARTRSVVEREAIHK
jgi:hypothetical protein